MSKSVKNARDFVDEYTSKNNKTLYMLGGGRLINLKNLGNNVYVVSD
jgi:S-adenosylhomocysteine hydrolase